MTGYWRASWLLGSDTDADRGMGRYTASMGSVGTKQVDIAWAQGTFAFRCFDNPPSIEIARAIFAGETYRPLDLLGNVRLIVDIGANIGAASIYFHTQYPHSRVVSVEPSSVAFALLAENARSFPQIEPHCT